MSPRKEEIEGEIKETTLMVAGGGEWRERKTTATATYLSFTTQTRGISRVTHRFLRSVLPTKH